MAELRDLFAVRARQLLIGPLHLLVRFNLVPDEVPLNLDRSVLYEGLEALPGGLRIALPVNLELDLVLHSFLDNSVTSDFFNFKPSAALL